VDELPADAEVAIDHARASSGDAMSHGADSTELFDVDMDELSWMLALVTANGFRLQGAELVQAQPAQNTTDGGGETPVSAAICLPVQR
jgi:hypothetical protein